MSVQAFRSLLVLEPVQMGQNTHDLGETVRLEDVEELKGLHLETKAGVDHQQDQVCNFGNVDHAVQVIVAFNEGQTPLLATDHRNRTLDLRERVLGEPLHQ